MKNDNKLVKITIFMLLITIIAISLVSGTFAKYTTSVSGSDTATVAKWSVKLNDTDVTTQTEITNFDLFNKSAIYDLAGVTNSDDLSAETGTAEADVAQSASDADNAKVAPGTWGKVSFKVENASDVTATYAVVIKSLTTTLPLKFSVDGKDWKTVADITGAMDESNPTYSLGDGTLAIGSATATNATVNLYWKWDFDKTAELNTADTTLGAAGTATCAITAGVTFTQVD